MTRHGSLRTNNRITTGTSIPTTNGIVPNENQGILTNGADLRNYYFNSNNMESSNGETSYYNRNFYVNSNQQSNSQQNISTTNNYSMEQSIVPRTNIGTNHFSNSANRSTTQINNSSVSSTIKGSNIIADYGFNNRLKETIHSGQFMVSDFEPDSEAIDDEYEAGMPLPSFIADELSGFNVTGESSNIAQANQRTRVQEVSVITMNQKCSNLQNFDGTIVSHRPTPNFTRTAIFQPKSSYIPSPTPIIDGSLTKLFQCMSLAYRQKLTSPKWNPFKGVRLRWKDKIRMNNVIWRCWHMQFVLRRKAMVCQFASPLDVDQHNKPEAVVMEGKYWKRKLSTAAAEYKKWRLFYRNRIMGWTHHHPLPDLHPISLDGFDWNRSSTFGTMSNFMLDEDLLMDFSDTLFSSLSSQPFAFPNPRELSRAGMVADFIQPGLVQLQPNLEDFMDTLEPFQDLVNTKFLPTVPEELTSNVVDSTAQTSSTNVELPKLLQGREQTSVFPKQNLPSEIIDNNKVSYAQQNPNSNLGSEQSRSMYYASTQTNELITNQRQPDPNVLAVTNASNLVSSQMNEAKDKPRIPKNTTSKDIFVVPKGKPRGRSRSGNRSVTNQESPIVSVVPHQGNQSQHTHIARNPGTSTSATSHTLLSQLLTTAGQSHYSVDNDHEKVQSKVVPPVMNSNYNTELQSRIALPGTIIDIQQHQQQPWNPKNAKDTLSPNSSLNFSAKAIMLNGGGVSPPLMSNTPSPPSPPKQFRGKNENEREHRRVCHINAEQKRRCNIKNGFDMLHSLIPQLSNNPNAKVSKAAMLQKGAEYIRQLKTERTRLKQEIETHRQDVEALNAAINNCQSLLPATGAPVSRQRTNKMKEMFDQWVRIRTLENWKFWLFSILVRPLLDSFSNTVSTASLDELCRTVLSWIDQHCSLVDLRPAVLNSLRFLCTTTDILTNPANLPEEALRAVNRADNSNERLGNNAAESNMKSEVNF